MSWFEESFFHQSVSTRFKIKKILHSEQSEFQKIEVFETEAIGKLLTLDGKTMVSDRDEFVYHEVMAHIPCAIGRNIKNVLILGGGDGGVVREFARHKFIENIHLVEIDERVIEVSKIFFPNCTSALTDPRVSIFPQDGIEFIKNKINFYDVIIIDSTDPENFAAGLFTKEFYASVMSALTKDGIMMAQTENPFYDQYDIKKIYDNLRNSFPIVSSFYAPMIIYPGVFWTFAFASKKYEPTDFSPEATQRYSEIENKLQWYNLNWHQGAFKLSNFHLKAIGKIL